MIVVDMVVHSRKQKPIFLGADSIFAFPGTLPPPDSALAEGSRQPELFRGVNIARRYSR